MAQREPIDMLLVEDDEVDVMIVQRAFKRQQILAPLQVARDSWDALTILRRVQQMHADNSLKRRLVCLDLKMPRMNGLEFLSQLRQYPNRKEIPVVALTTSHHETDRKRAYQLNVAAYILKSVGATQFAETMEALVEYWSLCEMP